VSNIAEGFERGGNQEFLQFLSIAKGSAGEVRSQLYLSLDQGYVDRVVFDRLRDLAAEVSGKLGALIPYLKGSGMKGPKYRVDEPETLNPELGTLNPEPGTLNPEHGTLNPGPGARQRGLSLVTAIFLMVVLAMLGAFMVSVSGLQQSSSVLDVQGVRAYESARAGVEWGAWQALDPNHAIGTAALPACPASPTNLTMAGSLSSFTVTVTCSATSTTEGNRNVGTYLIVATACNQPSAGSCPNGTPSGGYLERQIQATLAKCKDPTAAGPKFTCG
jgi:MSHA biogenesis protein MshP